MDLKECYAAMEGNYADVVARLMTEKLVSKFVLKFLNDASYENLVADMASENYDEAFREAHTLKGVSQNLSFTKLYKSSSAMTEALRNKDITEASALMAQVSADYEQTISAIKMLDT